MPKAAPRAVRWAFPALLPLLLLFLTGCGPTTVAAGSASGAACTDDAQGVVVAATATSAEPAPALPTGLRATLRQAADAGRDACVTVVAPDGGTGTPFGITPRRPNGQVENGPDRARKADENLDAVDTHLASLGRSENGLDPVGLIDDAVRLSPHPGTLYVITSGVSTEDPLDLRRLGWDLDADREARALARSGERVDLSGWTVHFVGLGDVAGDQPALSLALRGRLTELWLAVCRADGATACTADKELLPANPARSTDSVPVVDLPKVATVSANEVRLPDALTFTINSSTVQESANEALTAVVDRARSTGETLDIVGHTDAVTGSHSGNLTLSRRRAEAVAQRLTDLGLPTGQLAGVTGVGSGGASASQETADPGRIAEDRNVQITFSN